MDHQRDGQHLKSILYRVCSSLTMLNATSKIRKLECASIDLHVFSIDLTIWVHLTLGLLFLAELAALVQTLSFFFHIV